MLVSLALIPPPVSVAQGRSSQLPDEASVSVDYLRFVGAIDGLDPGTAIGQRDTALLVALRQPATLDEILARGIPIRSSQLTTLSRLGLLEQSGMTFRATFPILVGDEAESFRGALRDHLPRIAADAIPAFQRLDDALDAQGLRGAFPVVATWVVRERAWHHLVDRAQVDLNAVMESQRLLYPTRGWWGALWYVDPPQLLIHEVSSVTGRGRTLMLCWATDQAPETFAETRGEIVAAQFLAALDDAGTRVGDADRFRSLGSISVIDQSGRVTQRPVAWMPDRPGTVAMAAEQAALALADSVAANLSYEEIAAPFGIEELSLVATLAYAELAPELLWAMDAVGLSVLVGSGEREAGTTNEFKGPEGQQESSEGRPTISAIIWEGLPRPRPAFRIPW
jgi:hypothetical protein